MMYDRKIATDALAAALLGSRQEEHPAIIAAHLGAAWEAQGKTPVTVRVEKVISKVGKNLLPSWSMFFDDKNTGSLPFRDAQLGTGPGTMTAKDWCETQSHLLLEEVDPESKCCWENAEGGVYDDFRAWDNLCELSSENIRIRMAGLNG